LKTKNKIDTKVLGAIIKLNRLKQNISQRELSNGICVHSYLSKIENGEITATEEIIESFFTALHINFSNSKSFIDEASYLFNDYMEALQYGDFEISDALFEKVQKNKNKYLHSSMVVNYYFIILARNCGGKDRKVFEESKYLLESIIDNIDDKQKRTLHTYNAIDILHVSENYDLAIDLLNKALYHGETAQIYHWLSVAYLKSNNLIKAINYANKSLALYEKDINLNNVMSSYELIGKINMCNSYYKEAIHYFTKAHKICKRVKNNKQFEAYLFNKLAWCNMCLGDYTRALELINKDCYIDNLIPKLSPDCIKLIIYFTKNDVINVQKVYKKIKWNTSELYILLGEFFNNYLKLKEYIQSKQAEEVLLKIIKSSNNMVEVRNLFEKILILHYKKNRRYKEIVEIYEKNNETMVEFSNFKFLK
jgi:HTH-type transcriptional regulator, quorum sensing regulator NprR